VVVVVEAVMVDVNDGKEECLCGLSLSAGGKRSLFLM
jgi:hypothetical protein